VVLIEISEKAQGIPNFKSLPVTTQIALLHTEILEARRLRIPHAAICAVLNEVGSTVTVRYFRDVLLVLKKSAKCKSETFAEGPKNQNVSQPVPQKAVPTTVAPTGKLTPSAQRQLKADLYTSSDNPLFRQMNKS